MTECTLKYRIQEENSLAYRLRRVVRFKEKERSLHLIMDYPLKAMELDPSWKPVMRILNTGEFVAFQKILTQVDHASPERIASFFDVLLRKGFLENKGYLHLQEYPFVSIIIPVRNRPEEVSDCLESLSRLDYPEGKVEILVVDDASEDNTPEAISAFPVHLIQRKERGQAALCRNLAAREAQGDILAFLDSDCTVDPLWLRELVPAFVDPCNGAVGGRVDSFYNQSGLDRYEKVRSSLNMGSWSKSTHEGNPFFYVPSCNLLVRKELFLDLGGFKHNLYIGEDVDFCWRLGDQGHHVEYRPVGSIYHKHRNKIRQFCFRRFEYGTSEPFLQHTFTGRSKQLFVPGASALFWGLTLLSVTSGRMELLGLSGAGLFTDTVLRWIKIRQKHIPVTFYNLFTATFRTYFAVLYHVFSFVSRYYLFGFVPLLIVSPLTSAVVLGIHVIVGIVEYTIKKPRLHFPIFFLFFTLDQLFYQWGVWYSCVKRLFFGPINPRIVTRPPQKEPI